MHELQFYHTREITPLTAELRECGPLGDACAAYLESAVEEQALQRRSVDLFFPVLVAAARAAGDRPVDAVLTDAFLADFVASFPASPRQARRHHARRVMARVCTHLGRPIPSALRAPKGAPAPFRARTTTTASDGGPESEAGDDGIAGRETLTLVGLLAVEAEARFIVHQATQLVAEHTAEDADVLRAALVAFCHEGAAMPSDLAAMKVREVCEGFRFPGVLDPSVIGTVWSAQRTRRRARGREKNNAIALPLDGAARRMLVYWIAVRRRLRAAGAITGDAPLFVDPTTGAALTRRDVGKLVSGLGDPTSGTRTAKRPLALAAAGVGDPHVPALDLGISPESVDLGLAPQPRLVPTRVEINPSLLRHAAMLRVTIEEPAFSAAQDVFFARFGIPKYSGVARYRRLLGITTAPYIRGALSEARVHALRAHAQQAVRLASSGQPVPEYRDDRA